MGGVRSHECRFNEFKVLVLDEAPCLCTLGQRHCVQIKVGARLIRFVFRELNIAAVEYSLDKRGGPDLFAACVWTKRFIIGDQGYSFLHFWLCLYQGLFKQ